MIEEDQSETSFTDISADEFTPTSQTARKFILLTFIILLATPRADAPLTIDTRWSPPSYSFAYLLICRIMKRAVELLQRQKTSNSALALRREESRLSLRFISYCAF
jgi:hypothetical protein